MATTTRTLSGFFETILREVVDLSMREQPEEWPKVLRTLTSNKNVETFRSWAGLGLPSVKPELSPIAFDDPIQGPTREYTHRVTAKGFKVSYEAMEDDKYDIVSQTASSLGDCLKEGIEIDFSSVWNGCLAGDPVEILTFDAQNIADASHTRLDGGPLQSNVFTGDISLSLIQSFRYHFRNLRNDRGFRNQEHILSKLIIAPDSTTEPILDQILGGNGMQPFTSDPNTPHELGAMRGSIQKIVYSYLTDTDRTIALSQKALTKKGGPFAMWRRKPSMTSWDDDAIQGACYAGSYRNSWGCPDWHGIAVSGG